jgi:hypothetical protein
MGQGQEERHWLDSGGAWDKERTEEKGPIEKEMIGPGDTGTGSKEMTRRRLE